MARFLLSSGLVEAPILNKLLDRQEQTAAFITKCLCVLHSSGRLREVIPVSVAADRWKDLETQRIDDQVNEELLFTPELIIEELRLLLDGHTELTEYLRTQSFSLGYARLCTWLVVLDLLIADPEFSDWCQSGLKGVNKDAWLAELEAEGPGVTLILSLRERLSAFTLEDPFLDALCEHGKKLIQGEASVTRMSNRWSTLLDALKPADRKVLCRRLLDAAIAQGGASREFLSIYGAELLDAGVLIEDKSVVRRLFTPIVDKNDVSGAQWIAETISTVPQIIEVSHAEDVNDFKGRIEQLMNDVKEGEFADALRKIAPQIGVEPPTLEDEAEADEQPPKTEGGT